MKKSSDNMRRAGVNVKRLKSTIRRVEQQPYDATGDRRGSRGPSPPQLALTTSSITARSGTTAGTGTVAFQLSGAGTISAVPSGTTVTVRSYTATVIATGKYCTVQWFSGEWWIISVEC